MKITNSVLRRNRVNGLIVNGYATLIGENLKIEDSGFSGVTVWGINNGTSPELTATLRLSDTTISGSGQRWSDWPNPPSEEDGGGEPRGHFGILVNQSNPVEGVEVTQKYADVFLDRVTFKDNQHGSIYTQVSTTRVTVNDSRFFDPVPFTRFNNEGLFFGTGNTDGEGNPLDLPPRR